MPEPFAETVAFPARGLLIAGVILMLAGLALPVTWMVARTPSPEADQRTIDSGLLRPAIVFLPAGWRQAPAPRARVPARSGLAPGEFGVAESEIGQGQFLRVVRALPAEVVARGTAAGAGGCPSTLAPQLPVTCIAPWEAADYANKLTDLENAIRGGVLLSKCYEVQGTTARWANRACTGYRLPTADEWTALAAGGGTAGAGPARCPSGTSDCPGLAPVKATGAANAWFLYDASDNAAELVMRPDGRSIRWLVAGEGGAMRPWTARDPRAGFRIVRSGS